MGKSILSVILAGIFHFVVTAQVPDWQWQNPLPTGNKLTDVQFLDENNGWAVGVNGTILKTSNGGSTWQRQSSGTTNDLNSVHFTDAQTGWAVGSVGTILKTGNGGSTWQSQTSGIMNYLSSVHFTDAQTGWAVGSGGTLLKTSNGGGTWQSQSSGTANSLRSVHFTDAQTGWAVGDFGTILKTSNGGSSWQTQTSGITNYLNSVDFTDAQTGWAVGEYGSILKTSNGGITWQSQSSGTTYEFRSIHFTDAQTGWAAGMLGTILKTGNGGSTWQSQTSGTPHWLNSVHFTDAQTGWTVGDDGTVLKTSNGGSTWQSQNSGTMYYLNSIHFADAQTGWAVGSDGTLLKTSNGGSTWQSQNSGTTEDLYSSHFTNAQTGWAVGGNGTIVKTSNGGSTWQSQTSGTPHWLYSVHFTDAQTGWAVGGNGTIVKTSNGGSSWISQTSGTPNWLYSVHFTDAQTGWAVGDSGTILKTGNGGSSWQSQTSGTPNWLYSVHFTDAQTGWAVGDGGIVLKTSNGGSSWQSQTGGTTNSLRSVHFTDSQTGWAVGGNGTIVKTSNGGSSWISQTSGTTNYLTSVHFTDAQTGWAVGVFGTILHYRGALSPDVPASMITGKLFEKTGTDCHNTTAGIPYGVVKAIPGPYYGVASAEGQYKLRVPLAEVATSFTLSPVGYFNHGFQATTVCPSSGQLEVVVDTLPDTLTGKDFGFEITQCHHLDVQIASNRRRRCFQNTTTVSYVNQGSIPAPDANVMVEFPRWVRPLSASRPYIALNDSTWKFELDTVKAGYGGGFTVIDSVLCSAPINLTQCTRATIYPAPDCPPSSGWNGAEVSVSGVCDNGVVHLGIYNTGSGDMTDSVDYTVFLDSIQVHTGKVKLVAGDSLKLDADAYGMTVTLSANQVPNHPSEVFVSTSVEACDDTTMYVPRPTVNHFPKPQVASSKTQCLPIRASFDPNDKQAFPIGFTSNHVVKPGTEMEYLVRFQNTGNDTAFTVYVIDSLDNNLNVEHLEIGAVSHPYELTLQTTRQGRNFLRFQFNNILLPDSNTNELKSHGFIQYRISPKAGLALGSQAKNEAAIYFDFNPPVLTNRTLTTFDNLVFTNPELSDSVHVVVPTATRKTLKQLGLEVFPNPFSKTLHLKSISGAWIGASLTDVAGKVVKSFRFQSEAQLQLDTLSPGFYFLQVPQFHQSVKLIRVE